MGEVNWEAVSYAFACTALFFLPAWAAIDLLFPDDRPRRWRK